MTTVYFVRHGEAEGNVGRVFHGHFNSSLTQNGEVQAEKIRERLCGTHFDCVYSSDLDRAYNTALPMAKERGLEITKLSGLREIYGGEWENCPWDELPVKFPDSYNAWATAPHTLQMPGGESMQGFQDRVYTCLMDIVSENKGKSILITTHGTVLRVLLCKFKGLPLCEIEQVRWGDNTALTILEFDEDEKCRIVLESDGSHLGELSTLAKQKWWRE